MGKKQVTLSLDEDLYQTAQQTYGKGNVSDKIDQFFADDLNQTNPADRSPIHILEKSQLNEKQQEVVRRLIQQKIDEIPLERFNSWVENENIYMRSDFKKKAVEKISNDQYSLYTVEDQKLVVQQFKCRCGAQCFPRSFEDGYKCPGCGVEILEPFETEEFAVVGR